MRRLRLLVLALGCTLAVCAPRAGVHAQEVDERAGRPSLPAVVVERLRALPDAAPMAPWQRILLDQLTARDNCDSLPAQGDPPNHQALGDSSDGMWLGLNMPRGRYYPGVVYDPLRDRLVVFGGMAGFTPLNDLWQLTLRGTPAWTQLQPAGALPRARYGFSMVYDTHHDQVVVFGGAPGLYQGYLNDVWTLALGGTVPVWTQLAPDGVAPAARYLAAGAYDPVGDRLVLFGGDGAAWYNDTWALSLDGTPTWSEIATLTKPVPRAQMAVAYDAARRRMLIFGGYETNSNTNDLWALSLDGTPNWQLLHPVGLGPTARRDACAVYDDGTDQFVVFGGFSTQELNDSWELPLVSMGWMRVQTVGTVPPVRYGAGAAYDILAHRFLMFGGAAKSTSYSTAAALPLRGTPRWTSLNPPTPPTARYAASVAFDAARERLVVFGGINFLDFYADVWAFDLATSAWTAMQPAGTPPSPRGYASMVYDAARDRVVLFGGLADFNGTELGDVWAMSLGAQPAWVALAPGGTAPRPRYGHSAIVDAVHDRMIVFGGSTGLGTVSSETWALALADPPAWTPVATSATLRPVAPARYLHAAVLDEAGRRMIVSCGSGLSTYLNDTWSLALDGDPVWSQIAGSPSTPKARAQTLSAFDDVHRRLLMFGGYDGRSDLSDTWALSLAGTPAWERLTPVGLTPYARRDGGAVFDPSTRRFVVFGGYGGFHTYNDLAALQTPAAQAPGPTALALTPPLAGDVLRLADVQHGASLALTLRGTVHDGATLAVVDVRGRCVGRWALEAHTAADGPRGLRVDAPHTPGIYFAVLRDGYSLARQRFYLAR